MPRATSHTTLGVLLAASSAASCVTGAGGAEGTTGTTAQGPTSGPASGDSSDGGTTGAPAEPLLRLTVLHNNDGESQLIDAGKGLSDYGGVARFVALVDALRQEAEAGADPEDLRAVITLSSGDNFLAGPEWAASLDEGPPFYDVLALSQVGYDAICVGNHDFDFGPEVLAQFIAGFSPSVPFLSANLDVGAEPTLAMLADDGKLAASAVIEVEGGRKVGVIGATTPMLPFISSPRDVVVMTDVAAVVQDEVDALTADGVDIIILISHLQSIEEDLELAPLLSGVDVMIGGGGDELLANDDDALIPGDEAAVWGPYPLMAGDGVPIVTTRGGYRYVGRLVADFDAAGELVAIAAESGPVRVSGVGDDAVPPDPVVQMEVIDPLVASLATLDAEQVATSEVILDGRKSSVRTGETNEGDLIADALLWQAGQLAAEYGAPAPTVALQNGGGIRNDSELPAGPISVLDTFDMVPFPNFVAIVADVPPARFKELLENAVSKVEAVDGRFAQVAGFSFTYDPAAPARALDVDGRVLQEGERVVDVVLDDMTPIVQGGAVVPMAPTVHVATINFLANGGDQYPFAGSSFVTLGVTYQQAVRTFVESALMGTITAADYPEGGSGRIKTVP